jgi:hypothetical protein
MASGGFAARGNTDGKGQVRVGSSGSKRKIVTALVAVAGVGGLVGGVVADLIFNRPALAFGSVMCGLVFIAAACALRWWIHQQLVSRTGGRFVPPPGS